MSKKVKIVIDSDVVIHFIKGEALPILHTIFPQYEHVILDIVVREELNKNHQTRQYLERYTQFYKGNISIIAWNPSLEMTKEFAILKNRYGLGESASMVYCKFNQDVIASSNITEITNYCHQNAIQYITTMDFLWHAYTKGIMTMEECNDFITKVLSSNSKLPVKRLSDYIPREILM